MHGLTLWTRLRRWWFRRGIERTGREVDFTTRGWGHNITICGDSYAAWSRPQLQNGDIIITQRGRFLVYGVKACGEPPDMVFFDCIAERD